MSYFFNGQWTTDKNERKYRHMFVRMPQLLMKKDGKWIYELFRRKMTME